MKLENKNLTDTVNEGIYTKVGMHGYFKLTNFLLFLLAVFKKYKQEICELEISTHPNFSTNQVDKQEIVVTEA